MSLFSLNRPAHHARNRHQLRPRLDVLEHRRLLSITEFPTPTSNAGPVGITVGPDGNLWFTEKSAGQIGEINPTTHAVTEFATPTANSNPLQITVGPDGNLWFTESTADQVGEINPTTDVITEYPIPPRGSGSDAINGITAGPDGNLWFTESDSNGNAIGMINPTTHAVSVYSAPNIGSLPYGITAGPDGNLWFTEGGTGEIGEINPTTHAITQFAISTNFAGDPQAITAGPDGNLWFTDDLNGGSVGMINPTTHAITEFVIPTANSKALFFGITTGPDGNLWFTEKSAGQIGEINPTTGAIIEYPVPNTGSQPLLITAGPDGNLWFTDYGTSSIGVDTLNSASATFLTMDTTTEGSWIGVYGTQGYNVINATNGVKYPSYATVTPAGNIPYTIAANTTALPALQNPSGTGRIAACWYSTTSFTVDVDLTDGQSHNIELYLLDYNTTARKEQIQLTDANTGAILNTQNVSGFHNGIYLDYTISGNVLITFTKTGGANAVLSGLFFDPAAPTTTAVTSSLNPSTTGQSVTFTATVSDTGGGVPTGSVEFYDGSTDLGPGSALSGSGNSATSTLTTSTLTAGSHWIRALYSPTGNFAGGSGSLTQTVNIPPATASYLGADTTTQGSWIGVYGSQGYNVINATNGVDYPSYATVTPAGNASYTWAAHTNLVQALQNPSGSGRIAACWYTVPGTTSFTVDVDLTDGQAHNLELYLLDYGSTSRSENIVFTDANTHAVLSTQRRSSFSNGVYMDYTISGNVLITITKTGGANAVLSGLFFDPPPAPPAVVRGGNSTGGLMDATGVSTRLVTDPIGTLDPPSAPRSSLSTTARLSAHDAALWGVGISASSNPVTHPLGTVDPSGNDPAALALMAGPINPNGKLVHDLAMEQVSIGQTWSRARFGQQVVATMNDGNSFRASSQNGSLASSLA
jgi:streptogramin lyase